MSLLKTKKEIITTHDLRSADLPDIINCVTVRTHIMENKICYDKIEVSGINKTNGGVELKSITISKEDIKNFINNYERKNLILTSVNITDVPIKDQLCKLDVVNTIESIPFLEVEYTFYNYYFKKKIKIDFLTLVEFLKKHFNFEIEFFNTDTVCNLKYIDGFYKITVDRTNDPIIFNAQMLSKFINLEFNESTSYEEVDLTLDSNGDLYAFIFYINK